MTTTPDSRIRADWTLPAETDAPPPTVAPDTSTTDTPDTSTTAGKIAVMQAYERGEPCQWRPRQLVGPEIDWQPVVQQPQWNWSNTQYRIAPPPVARTALQAARERAAMVPPTGGDADNSVRDLLKQIDNSIVVTIEHFKLPHYGATKPEDLQPGRYRLVRDDA